MSGVPEVVVPAEPRDGPAHALRRSARVVARLPKANGGGVVLLAVANSLEYRDIVRAVDALTVPWRPGTNEPYLYVKLLPRAPQL